MLFDVPNNRKNENKVRVRHEIRPEKLFMYYNIIALFNAEVKVFK